MPETVAVTGAAGMLGTACLAELATRYRVVAASRRHRDWPAGVNWSAFDLLDFEALRRWLATTRPSTVVHCAANVNVDECEREPDRARALHVVATDVIASALGGWGGRLVYISTDSVFDGTKPHSYSEADATNPLNVYARTKLEGEQRAMGAPKALVLRTNIFGWSDSARPSFAEWVLKGLVSRAALTMFTDVAFTPIHVGHLAAEIAAAFESDLTGVFHAGGADALSKYEFAVEMAAVFGLQADAIVPTSVDASGLSANRPKNMRLDSSRLANALGRTLPAVKDGLILLRDQYLSGWVGRLKGIQTGPGYHF